MLPGSEEEDTADGEVGQQHEEPDSRRERIQEGEVAWFSPLEHIHTPIPLLFIFLYWIFPHYPKIKLI